MQRDLRVYLWDLEKALREIETFVTGKAFDDYLASRMMQLAIERNFITVGEILSRILHHFPEAKERIEHARRISDFRNVLVHEYHRVKDDAVWDVATKAVPVLAEQVQVWLREIAG